MQDLATVWTSAPLGNYSYGSFTRYSPPVEVHVHGLNISNANPVLVQLRVANNKRNLQIQLDPQTGLNVNVSWTKQAYAINKSSCDSDCVQATLTTEKCGVPPLIQPLSILGASTKVGSDKILGLTAPGPAFLWTDGFQTAFTDEHGESNSLAASGIGAGFSSTITIPPSETETVIRLFVGVIGANGQLTAYLNGTKRVAAYNTTLMAGPGDAANFGTIALQVPASTVPLSARVKWFQTGPEVTGAVLLGAIAVGDQSNATALGAMTKTSPVRKCAAPSRRSGHAGTVMLQAAALK